MSQFALDKFLTSKEEKIGLVFLFYFRFSRNKNSEPKYQCGFDFSFFIKNMVYTMESIQCCKNIDEVPSSFLLFYEFCKFYAFYQILSVPHCVKDSQYM